MTFLTRAVAKLVQAICILLLLLLTGAVVYATVFRYLGASPVWYDEMAQVLLAWLTYFAAVHAMFKRQHMSFAGLVLAMPKPLRLVLVLTAEAAIVLFFGVAVYFGAMLLPIAAYDALLSLPWVSMAVVQSVIPITGALMIFASLSTLPKVLREAMAGIDREHAEIEEAIAATEAELRASNRKGVV
jgi:TRAP-type C4-dicarboxylate transport system permease small subunit